MLKFGRSYAKYGKSVFYFGLVFFCISLISKVVSPLTENADILHMISHITSIPIAIIIGIILTTIFQSSSVTSGVILALATGDLINLSQGIGLMLGANIGTATTALLVALPMDIEAKKTAIGHFLFNTIGALLIYPFLPLVTKFITSFGGDIPQQIANMHLFFNIAAAAFFLLFIQQFYTLINWLSKFKFFHIHISGTKIGV